MLGFEGVGLAAVDLWGYIRDLRTHCSACVKTYFMGEFTHSAVGINIFIRYNMLMAQGN